jgi:hypothetical protein
MGDAEGTGHDSVVAEFVGPSLLHKLSESCHVEGHAHIPSVAPLCLAP